MTDKNNANPDSIKIRIDDIKKSFTFTENDMLETLHEHVRGLEKNFMSRMMKRYCGVCFFGSVAGNVYGIPICDRCFCELFKINSEKPTLQLPDTQTLFMKMAFKNRDAFELLRMKLIEENERNAENESNKDDI